MTDAILAGVKDVLVNGNRKPNAEILAVMKETAEREAKGIRPEKTFSSVEELFEDLDTDD